MFRWRMFWLIQMTEWISCSTSWTNCRNSKGSRSSDDDQSRCMSPFNVGHLCNERIAFRSYVFRWCSPTAQRSFSAKGRIHSIWEKISWRERMPWRKGSLTFIVAQILPVSMVFKRPSIFCRLEKKDGTYSVSSPNSNKYWTVPELFHQDTVDTHSCWIQWFYIYFI